MWNKGWVVKAREGSQRTDVVAELRIGYYYARPPEGGCYVGIFKKK